jgi:hypothetical protein
MALLGSFTFMVADSVRSRECPDCGDRVYIATIPTLSGIGSVVVERAESRVYPGRIERQVSWPGRGLREVQMLERRVSATTGYEAHRCWTALLGRRYVRERDSYLERLGASS